LLSDGRPIVGLSARQIAQIALEVDSRCLIIPAIGTLSHGCFSSSVIRLPSSFRCLANKEILIQYIHLVCQSASVVYNGKMLCIKANYEAGSKIVWFGRFGCRGWEFLLPSKFQPCQKLHHIQAQLQCLLLEPFLWPRLLSLLRSF